MSDEVPLTRRAAREAEQGKRVPAEPATEILPATNNAEDPATVVVNVEGAASAWAAGGAAAVGAGSVGAPAAGSGDSGDEPPRSRWRGFADAVSRHPNAWMFASLGVIFLLLGTVSVFTGVAVGSAASLVPVVTETATPTPEPTRGVPAETVAATALRTCSIAALATDPRLLSFAGSVINITTGEVLFDRNATAGASPASGLKVLTAAAALSELGPDYQMTTRVVEGKDPGSIVLVGGGDPTLSALPPGVESVYTGAPKLSDLATQTHAAWEANHPGEEITKIVLDASYWNPSDSWDPTWDRVEQRDGWQSDVTALMVDGDRDNPQAIRSRRSDDPIGRAGSAFRAALDLGNDVEVVVDSAPSGATQLAEVKSRPLSTLIAQMLQWSDNTLGENIARVVSKSAGGGGSAASLSSVIPRIISDLGLDASVITVRDGSGLSPNNLVPPLFMAQLMAKVATSERNLGVIKSGLPVAGESGSLSSRFSGDNAVARGQVTGKTGWIDTSRTLSGWVNANDGSVLSFAFYALGPVEENATIALDTVTTGVFRCGNNLSNN